MLMSHRICLDPNNVQATYFAKAAGIVRFAYNWALSEWNNECKAGGHPSEAALRRKLNSIKRDQFPWMLEVTKNAPQMAIIQLGKAFRNFFSKRTKYPKFKKKGIHDRFSITNDQFEIKEKRIKIPRLGWVRMREKLRYAGKIISATISKEANRWYVSVTVDSPEAEPKAFYENQVKKAIGVDLGLLTLATLSNGEHIIGPKPHKALESSLLRLSRALTRKKIGSKNWQKAKLKLATLYVRMKNIRLECLHQLTNRLTKNGNKLIGIEDLNISGMLKNRRLARSVQDMGFYEFRRQLEYKAKMRGCRVVVTDRFFASSKICNQCKHQNESLLLNQRQWRCELCGTEHERDLNAANNLRDMAASSAVSACGERGSGCGCINHNETALYEAGIQQ